MGDFVMASSMETSVQNRVKELALEITRCPAFTGAEIAGPCSKVVEWQADQLRDAGHDESEIRDAMHVPEGWAGNLATARILYLSSNPSFHISENYPNPTWAQTATVDFVTRRFSSEQSRPYGALDGPIQQHMDRAIQRDGRPGKKVNTWAELSKRTSILLERPVDEISADRDYVMTEVVHCKSKREQGAPEAVSACTLRWPGWCCIQIGHRSPHQRLGETSRHLGQLEFAQASGAGPVAIEHRPRSEDRVNEMGPRRAVNAHCGDRTAYRRSTHAIYGCVDASSDQQQDAVAGRHTPISP
jgi:hypothetical protein